MNDGWVTVMTYDVQVDAQWAVDRLAEEDIDAVTTESDGGSIAVQVAPIDADFALAVLATLGGGDEYESASDEELAGDDSSANFLTRQSEGRSRWIAGALLVSFGGLGCPVLTLVATWLLLRAVSHREPFSFGDIVQVCVAAVLVFAGWAIWTPFVWAPFAR